MEIPAKYNPVEIENKWYQYWLEHKFFRSEPDDRENYVVVIPPPNVTGVLHMGHMLNNTIQDVLVRRARMLSKNTVWLPGTDHASIATEAKVVAKLKAEGIDKSELTRDEFLKHAWIWKEKHGGIILDQLKKLGASCDWDRTNFTMDDHYSESVIQVFVDLFRKGKIYRGARMINWDPQAKTAVSDEEVNYKEVQSKLYYIQYIVEGSENEWVTIATTRPETILGDTAVCVNPKDERYRNLVGKRVLVPLINRSIPIIEDDYVDVEFGTGCLKITPAHDINDYEIGLRHGLDTVDIFNDDGTLSAAAQMFIGIDRFKAREYMIESLQKKGHIVKIEDYTNKIGFSERTEAVIEPKLSTQWFVKMKELAKPALDAVMNDEVKIHPAKFKNTYRHWMENVKDWCISRQLWWGHRIPAYYIINSKDFVVAPTMDEAIKSARAKTGNQHLTAADLRQDEDVLDTWFSSWLWPIATFDGIRKPDGKDINYYYPTNDLVTAPEILFFWVARMIMAGYEFRGQKPFSNVYLHGIVRDSQGRKMSKQFNNSPDPINLMEKYGADGVRYGMLLSAPAGNDLLFDEDLCEQGRNFCNKIWNALRLVKGWQVSPTTEQPVANKIAINWFTEKLNETIIELDTQFCDFRISESLMTVFKLFRDEFSSWYLEFIKPPYEKPIDKLTYDTTIEFFNKLLKLLHPFMPFLTEEIWQLLEDRKDGASIMVADLPIAEKFDKTLIDKFEYVKEIIANIRTIRKEKNIPFKDKLNLHIKADASSYNANFDELLIKANNLETLQIITEKPANSMSFIVKAIEYFVPVGDLVNNEEEIKKLTIELDYAKGFLTSVMKKLSNERFVQNAAPAVIELERKKQADAEMKIKALEEQIKGIQ